MAFLDVMIAPSTFSARLLNPLQSLFALGARWYVSLQFFKAGYLKYTDWPTTLSLFTTEYHVPWLSPHDAAVAGTFGELFFPTLLAVGLYARLSAIGLFVVNAVAVVSYQQVLLAEGAEAALGQHVLWGTLILFVMIYGPAKISLDYLFNRARL
jgi:putative oxidoreductase